MTEEQARELVHSAFYRIVRQANPTPIDEFFEKSIEETWPDGETPSGWSDFWWESVAVEIQNAVMSRKEYVLDFDRKWLKDNKTQPWESLITFMGDNLVPLT